MWSPLILLVIYKTGGLVSQKLDDKFHINISEVVHCEYAALCQMLSRPNDCPVSMAASSVWWTHQRDPSYRPVLRLHESNGSCWQQKTYDMVMSNGHLHVCIAGGCSAFFQICYARKSVCLPLGPCKDQESSERTCTFPKHLQYLYPEIFNPYHWEMSLKMTGISNQLQICPGATISIDNQRVPVYSVLDNCHGNLSLCLRNEEKEVDIHARRCEGNAMQYSYLSCAVKGIDVMDTM